MRKVLQLMLVFLLCPLVVTDMFADNPVKGKMLVHSKEVSPKKVITGEFSCPDNTIHSEPYDPSASQKSMMSSDQGRPDGATKIYQSFSACTNPISGIQCFAIWANYSYDGTGWQVCNDRLQTDEDGNLLESIRLEVGFYEFAEDGLPGKQVYVEEFDVVGVKTDATWGNEAYEPVGPIYSFTMNFREKVKMENGYVSVSAVDMGDSPSCWFTLISHTNVSHSGLISWQMGGDLQWFGGNFCYCFLGDANEPLAKKGIRLERILSPVAVENGKYAKVQVEVYNYGEEDADDVTLELWMDGELLATEKVDEVVYSGYSYKYTFFQRVDCSEVGEHTVMVKNVTPGDEFYAAESISSVTSSYAELCDSYSTYTAPYIHIYKVQIGDISNESSNSGYSDFRDLKTELRWGETLTLTVDLLANKGNVCKVWVDWNGNGSFEDDGDFVGYASNGSIPVKIPDKVEATPGEKCMRIILCDKDIDPCGSYTFGETEDYTLVLVRPDDSPLLSMDKTAIDKVLESGATVEETIYLKNEGTVDLDVDAVVEYQLPNSPDVYPMSHIRPKSQENAPVMKIRPGSLPSGQMKAPERDDETQYVLKYGTDYYGGAGSSGERVSYAHYYPGKMLAGLSGMKIASVDVYVETPSSRCYVVVYGQGLQCVNGDLILEQRFVPEANAWNHIELDTPVTISDEDLFVGVAFEDVEPGAYQIGVDKGPVNIGFGDLISIGANYWWSMSDLGGGSGNVLIRANVTGERTPDINWMSLDKKQLTLASGQSDGIKVELKTEGLADGVHDAVIGISSNDPFATSVKIPVYLNITGANGIAVLEDVFETSIYADGNRTLVVKSEREVAYMAAFGMAGNQVCQVYGRNRLSLSGVSAGYYVVRVVFCDGAAESATVMVR